MRKLILALALLFATSAQADNLGSAKGGQAAPQSGLAGGLCYTAPIALTDGQQAALPIDCTTHALIVEIVNSGSSSNLRTISTGASDFTTSADFGVVAGHAIFWNSATASAKTENLIPCNAASNGYITTIVDEIGTAGTYAITLTPSAGNTINTIATYAMAFNQQSVTVQCNGVSNWVLL